jgi:DtxR family Mn-dependent transcriptional regulator
VFSIAEENYIKAIFHIQQRHGRAGTNLLSGEMKTRPASVTDMLKKLEAKQLVKYEKYKGFSLSAEGSKLALSVIRKHRLWEYFLVEKLGFNWDEVHDLAEQLEHISSDELIAKLDQYLGHPGFDPHGDPIPDVQGRMQEQRQENLQAFPLQKKGTVTAVKDQQFEMLNLLKHLQIRLGSVIHILNRFAYDGSVEIAVDKQAPTIVSARVAENIYLSHV